MRPIITAPDGPGGHAVGFAFSLDRRRATGHEALTVTSDAGSMPPQQIDETGAAHALRDAIPTVPAPAPDWLAPPTGWTDSLTSMDGPMFWARLITHESARIRRYKRPATVVVIDVIRLAELHQLWGAEVAVRTLVQVGATITKQVRSSDAVARIGPTQFGVYLPETNEIDAINFVERTRGAIGQALGRMAETVTVAIGWASPTNGSLDDAIEVAERRLERDAQESSDR